MMIARCCNPDDYLETPAGRIYSPELSAEAWNKAYSDLQLHLSEKTASSLYVVVGIQGAGKSFWIQANAEALGNGACFFDAALPKAKHRKRILDIARSFGVPAIAVWVKSPLAVALARNRRRRPDHRVPEEAIRAVFAQFEPPTTQEGFTQIIEVSNGERHAGRE